jgi:Na+/H+-translocating membrane pyrophosphatase
MQTLLKPKVLEDRIRQEIEQFIEVANIIEIEETPIYDRVVEAQSTDALYKKIKRAIKQNVRQLPKL